MLYRILGLLRLPFLWVSIIFLCVGAVVWAARSVPDVYLVAIIGALVLAALLALVIVLWRWRKRRKAKQFEEDLAEERQAEPTGESDRARLEALRKKFEEGLQVFKARGKDLYSLPWYLVVGEPAAGKTEAVRRADLSFPVGLHDQYQGVGGTLNMHWWFTNHGILLDTAGRMFLEGPEAGRHREWSEFLKLLRKHRQNCPINGLILAIPADRLITDSHDEINRKATLIAQQLARVQESLDDVRFPVFVVLTKCDLLCGFRELTASLEGPNVEHQMVGWSNPASLEEPFRPSELTHYFEPVVERIGRRILGLMIDPVPEDPELNKLDEVDRLYALPASVEAVLPRLRTYLDRIFVPRAEVWSSRQPFLRGIYLTSAMREGSVLDAALAKALELPPEALPDEGSWERERAFFLHDVFTEKVFPEDGLVTWAKHPKRERVRRRSIVLGAACAAVLLLLGLTWWGAHTLDRRIGAQQHTWEDAAGSDHWTPEEYWRPIVEPVSKRAALYTYANPRLRVAGRSLCLSELHTQLLDYARSHIDIPSIFTIVAPFHEEDLNQDRYRALGVLFESGVLGPLLAAARNKLQQEDQVWSEEATAALIELIRLETYGLKTRPPISKALRLAPLFEYVLRRGKSDEWREAIEPDGEQPPLKLYLADQYRDTFQHVFDWVYAEDGGRRPWPPRWLCLRPTLGENPPIEAGLERLISRLEREATKELPPGLRQTLVLAEAVSDFADQEEKLLDTFPPERKVPTEFPEFDLTRRDWNAAYGALANAGQRVHSRGADISTLRYGSLRECYDEIRRAARVKLERVFTVLPPFEENGDAYSADDVEKQMLFVKAINRRLYQALVAVEAATREPLPGFLRYLETCDKDFLRSVAVEAAPPGKQTAEPPAAAVEGFEKLKKAAEQKLAKLEGKGLRKAVTKQTTQAAGPGPVQDEDRLYQIRLRMYSLANAELSASQPEGTPSLSQLGEHLDEAQKRIDAALAEVDQLRELALKAYRVQRAASVAEHILHAAQRRRNHDVVERALDVARTSRYDVGAHVEKRARPRSRPAIPLTNTDGGTFPARYDPLQAAHILSEWWQSIQTVQETEAPMFNRQGLLARQQEFGRSYRAYASAYVDYWARTGPKDAITNEYTWDALQQALLPVQVWDIQTELKKLCTSTHQALSRTADWRLTDGAHEKIAASVALAAQRGSETAEQGAFTDHCKYVLDNWKQLSERTAFDARDVLLNLTPEAFLDKYVFVPQMADRDLAKEYWSSLDSRLMGAIADEYGRRAVDNFKELLTFVKFPLLAPPEETAGEMTLQEISRAWELLEDVTLPAKDPQKEGKILREGAKTEAPTVDRLLRGLAEPPLSAKDRNLLARLAPLCQALPKDRPYTCKISLLPLAEQDKRAVYYWREFRVNDGPRVKTKQSAMVELAGLKYPGDRLMLRLYRFPADDTPNVLLSLDGGWACLRLLHGGWIEPVKWMAYDRSDDGKTWEIRLNVHDGARPSEYRTFRLQLELEQEFPPTSEWPRR